MGMPVDFAIMLGFAATQFTGKAISYLIHAGINKAEDEIEDMAIKSISKMVQKALGKRFEKTEMDKQQIEMLIREQVEKLIDEIIDEKSSKSKLKTDFIKQTNFSEKIDEILNMGEDQFKKYLSRFDQLGDSKNFPEPTYKTKWNAIQKYLLRKNVLKENAKTLGVKEFNIDGVPFLPLTPLDLDEEKILEMITQLHKGRQTTNIPLKDIANLSGMEFNKVYNLTTKLLKDGYIEGKILTSETQMLRNDQLELSGDWNKLEEYKEDIIYINSLIKVHKYEEVLQALSTINLKYRVKKDNEVKKIVERLLAVETMHKIELQIVELVENNASPKFVLEKIDEILTLPLPVHMIKEFELLKEYYCLKKEAIDYLLQKNYEMATAKIKSLIPKIPQQYEDFEKAWSKNFIETVSYRIKSNKELQIKYNVMKNALLEQIELRNLQPSKQLFDRVKVLSKRVGKDSDILELQNKFNEAFGLVEFRGTQIPNHEKEAIENIERQVNGTFKLLRQVRWNDFGIVIRNNSVVQIGFYSRHLKSLPNDLSKLSSLKLLNLTQTYLKAFPDWIANLQDISTLMLRFCSFNKFPIIITKLKNLRRIDLSYNQIDSIPDEISALENLVEIRVNHNRIKKLPEVLLEMKNLKVVYCLENKLDNGSMKILDTLRERGVRIS